LLRSLYLRNRSRQANRSLEKKGWGSSDEEEGRDGYDQARLITDRVLEERRGGTEGGEIRAEVSQRGTRWIKRNERGRKKRGRGGLKRIGFEDARMGAGTMDRGRGMLLKR